MLLFSSRNSGRPPLFKDSFDCHVFLFPCTYIKKIKVRFSCLIVKVYINLFGLLEASVGVIIMVEYMLL